MIEEKAKYRKLLAKRSPTKLIEVLKETLGTMDFVVFAYLYGSLLSWLKGSTLPPGDVDLAIYTEESIPAPKADKDARLYDFMEKMAREKRQLLFLEEAYGQHPPTLTG